MLGKAKNQLQAVCNARALCSEHGLQTHQDQVLSGALFALNQVGLTRGASSDSNVFTLQL